MAPNVARFQTIRAAYKRSPDYDSKDQEKEAAFCDEHPLAKENERRMVFLNRERYRDCNTLRNSFAREKDGQLFFKSFAANVDVYTLSQLEGSLNFYAILNRIRMHCGNKLGGIDSVQFRNWVGVGVGSESRRN